MASDHFGQSDFRHAVTSNLTFGEKGCIHVHPSRAWRPPRSPPLFLKSPESGEAQKGEIAQLQPRPAECLVDHFFPVPTPLLRAFQWDLARQVERLDILLKLLPRYAEWGYQELYLHLEDAVAYPSLPGVARADAYSYEQLGELVETARGVGIGVVPIVNLLGHTQYLIKVPALRELNELRGDDGSPLVSGQICPLHPRTQEVAERLIGDMAPFCTAGKIHLGLDESFHLGKCPRCRAEVADHGLAHHFSEYVNRLHALTTQRGLRLGFWADMLNFIPEAIPRLPTDVVAYDWYYYPFRRHPRVELYNFAESDLATPLRARGIEYWGCPMNGAFRFEPLPLFRDRFANIRSWWARCQRVGAAGMLITSWEAYRLGLEITTAVDAGAANLWLSPRAARHDGAMLKDGFTRVFGRKGAAACARLAQGIDKYPFSGYARWETNDRWDAAVSSKPDAESVTEATFFSRAEKAARGLPRAFAASVAFRAYLAYRDLHIHRAVEGVRELRRLGDSHPSVFHGTLKRLQIEAQRFSGQLRVGRNAAQTLWRCTRDPAVKSQNEIILEHDAERLLSWREWLKACRSDPRLVHEGTPVWGRWQLIFTVINFAPALQRVSVEQQQPNGSWKELHGRYTIEFQAIAARPRTRIKRLFSTPLDTPDQPLRIVVRGLGKVILDQIVIKNGPHTLCSIDPKRTTVGEAAPTEGLPEINRRLEEMPLRFKRERSRRVVTG